MARAERRLLAAGLIDRTGTGLYAAVAAIFLSMWTVVLNVGLAQPA